MRAPLACPETECWQALFNDTVPADQRERYERHLESCPACQARLDRAEDGGDALLRLARQIGDPTLGPADATLSRVLERLVGEPAALAAGSDPAANAAGSPKMEPADLFFLHPANRPGVLGTLGEYEVLEVIDQ